MKSVTSGGSLRRPCWPASDKIGRSFDCAKNGGSRSGGMMRSNTSTINTASKMTRMAPRKAPAARSPAPICRPAISPIGAAQQGRQDKADDKEHDEEGERGLRRRQMKPLGDDRIDIGHQRDRDRRGDHVAENGGEAAQQAGAEAGNDCEGETNINSEVEEIDRQSGLQLVHADLNNGGRIGT